MLVRLMTAASDAILKAHMSLARGPSYFPLALVLQ